MPEVGESLAWQGFIRSGRRGLRVRLPGWRFIQVKLIA
jgi:hypothetical protein